MAFPRFEPDPDGGVPPLFSVDGAADNATTNRGDAANLTLAAEAAEAAEAADVTPEAAQLLAAFTAAVATAMLVPTRVAVFDAVSNPTIEQLHQKAGELLRQAGLLLAMTAAQIQRRSAPSLGREGMARKSGHRTPEAMTTRLGGINRHDAVKALRDGKLIHNTQTVDAAERSGTDPIDPLTQEPVVVEEPWLIGVGRARTAGMSAACADAIRLGLGTPTEAVTEDMLRTAADRLCALAERLGPDLLLVRARRVRDELDILGIGLREEERRQKRSASFTRQRDGMSRLVLLLDTESGAVVGEIYDRLTSPKRGGPRMGDGADGETAARILDDDRTATQLAADGFVQLLTNGVAADASLVLGPSVPAVRILTTAPIPGHPAPARPTATATATSTATATATADSCSDCDERDNDKDAATGHGEDAGPNAGADDDGFESYEVNCQNGKDHKHTRRRRTSSTASPAEPLLRVAPAVELYGPGWIEGQTEPVSADTIARLACTGSTSTITFDENGQPIDVSSEHRLFGRKQRHGLSARDGGCMWTDASGAHTCDRPPSWTEAHHVEQWDRDGGKTTILNGILLCKYHHLTLHNDGWEIHRVGTRYWLIPPVTVDRAQTPRLIRSRSDAYAQLDHLAHRTGPAAPSPATERVDTARATDSPEPDERMTSTGMTYLYIPRRNSTHASNRDAAASTDPPSDQQSDATGPAGPGSPPAR